MVALNIDLQQRKSSLHEFYQLTERILHYLPNILSNYELKNGYRIYNSNIAGTIKYIRPINQNLFIFSSGEFEIRFPEFETILTKCKREVPISKEEMGKINSVIYTIQQSIGAGLDLMVDPNSARKHVGNRWEELVKSIFTEIGIANKKVVLQIPYETGEGTKIYQCENDLILSPKAEVQSSSSTLDKNEVVVSVKTTSKDRMGKMFIDKLLLERFVGHDQKVIGIFLNDIQRKENSGVSYTLVSGLFMVYSKFLVELQGIYYVDPPPQATREPFNKYIKSFSHLISQDIWRLLSS